MTKVHGGLALVATLWGCGATVTATEPGAPPDARTEAAPGASAGGGDAVPSVAIEPAPAPTPSPSASSPAPWHAVPRDEAEMARYLDAVCAAANSDEGDAAARAFATLHLPEGTRPVVGNVPLVGDDAARWRAPTDVTPVMLDGAIRRRRLRVCARPRRILGVAAAGDAARATLDVEGQPFEALVKMGAGTARLERFSLMVDASPRQPAPTRTPDHEVILHADDLTRSEEGRNAAKIVRVFTRSTGCIEAFVLAEEARLEPELGSSAFVVVFGRGTPEDGEASPSDAPGSKLGGGGDLGPAVSVFADGVMPLALLRCLTGGLRKSIAGIPRLMRLARDFPLLAYRPVVRVRYLIPLRANELGPGADILEMGP